MIYILETHNDAAPEQRDQSSAAQHSTRQCTAQNAHEQRTQAARALEAVACLVDSSVSKSRAEGKFGGVAYSALR